MRLQRIPRILRVDLRPSDPEEIETLVTETGLFSAEEVSIARELADEGLAQGAASHYRFVLSDINGKLAGYACFGPVPCTREAWDLYWIAVAPPAQGQHLGRELLGRVEFSVLAAGGTRIYVDTSSRQQYLPTRAFYAGQGYKATATFPDFYAPGDGKVVFSKVLDPTTA